MKEGLVLIEAIGFMILIIISLALPMANSSNPLLAYYSILPAISAFGSDGGLTSGSLAGVMYVQNSNGSSVSVVDLATNTILLNMMVDGTLHNIELSEDQLTLHIMTTNRDSGTIFMLNTTNNELIREVSTEASVQDIATVNDTLYISDETGGRVLVTNVNGTFINEIDVGSGPQFMEVRPDGQVLYVTSLRGPISVVDLEQNVVIKEIDSGSMPHRLSFTNDGSRLFVVNAGSDTLSVIDSHKHEIIKTIPVGDNPQYVALNPDETLAYVTNKDSNTASIVDTQAIEVINEIAVGNGPYGIAFSADSGDSLYVSNTRGNDLSIIDTTSNNISDKISTGGAGPNQVVVRKPDIEIVRDEDKNSNSNNSPLIARVFVEVPDDLEESMRGLMFRKHLPGNAGMLFAYYDEKPRTFWMKNTLIPLDMIFVNGSSKIIEIKENVPPCAQDECPTYPSKEPAQYVLEVNAGFVQEKGIKVGDRLVAGFSELDDSD